MYIYQDFYYLANILANTNDLLGSDFYHLANTLTNTNDMLKIGLCYLAITLTSTNDEANNFTKERLVAFN